MMYRVLPLLLAVLALALFVSAPALAADKDNTHEGTVVKAGDGKLTMTLKGGKDEHMHDVAKDATITCEGKKCKLEDLKKGFTVKVTEETKDGKKVVTKIEAKKPS
jgi:hypothetical protein